MSKAFFTLLFISSVSFADAQIDTSIYTPLVKKFERTFEKGNSDSIYLMFNDQMKKAVPESNWSNMLSGIKSQVGKIDGFSFLKLENGIVYYTSRVEKMPMLLHLVFDSNMQIGGLYIRPSESTNTAKTKSNFTYKTDIGTLYGTITMPANNNKKVPVVLIIAGSGPTDRNGNSPLGVTANSYSMLSDSLNKHGIASLRFDKRFIGESSGFNQTTDELVIEDYVSDAIGLINQLKKDDRFSKVIVLGHSEGSLIGMLAASKANADAFISVAGAGENVYDILKKQLNYQPKEFSKKALPILDSLKKGHRVINVPGEVANLFHSSVQPYLLSWLKYDPQQEIKSLKIPVLIIHGTTDIQGDASNALLLKKAKPNADIQMIKGMNHILKSAPADRTENAKTYTDPSLPLMTEFITAIKYFIQKIK